MQRQGNKIVLVEPYYEGVLVPDICAAMGRMTVSIETIGVPHKVLFMTLLNGYKISNIK